MIISPMVVPTLRLKKIASTSVPSITAPPLTASPIPAPRKKPPNTATNKLSLVTLGKGTIARHTARPVIAKAVLMANCFPITVKARIMKGMFITIIRYCSGIFVKAVINNEIPVAPPSIKPFVSKKPLKPNDAENIPAVIRIRFLSDLLTMIKNSRYPFAS